MRWQRFIAEYIYGEQPRTVTHQDIIKELETWGKSIATILGLIYVLGLVTFTLFHSKLHIRNIEFLKSRYILVGTYCAIFIFFHLFFQQYWIKKLWGKFLYSLFFIFLTITYIQTYSLYMAYIRDPISSSIQLADYEASYLKEDMIMTIGIGLLAPLLYGISKKFWNSRGYKVGSILFLLFSIMLSYQLFIDRIFPNIPEGLGGGESPVVEILFSEDVPNEVRSLFDVTNTDQKPLSSLNSYYARLIYMDNSSVFLREPLWYSNSAYEFKREQIKLLHYYVYDPFGMGHWK